MYYIKLKHGNAEFGNDQAIPLASVFFQTPTTFSLTHGIAFVGLGPTARISNQRTAFSKQKC